MHQRSIISRMQALKLWQPLFAPDTGGGSGSTSLALSGSVGSGGVNRPQDVLAIKARFRELGFGGFDNSDRADPGLVRSIKLFQSIIRGQQKVSGDGRIDLRGPTLSWLQDANAPRWQRMPLGSRTGGFYNYGIADQPNDPHQYGTLWLADTISAAGAKYLADHRSHDLQRRCPILVNDSSLPQGHDTSQHSGHETGLSCDLRLPNVDGALNRSGVTWTSNDYDRSAMRAMLQALSAQELHTRTFFNDPTLIREGLCVRAGGHDNHAHVEITAKPRESA